MARKIKKGATDISVILRAIDSTTGAPKTDFAYNTAGIDLWYRRNGATVTSITEATLAAADTAHSDGGVIHLGNGYFRLDPPDAAFATGSNSVMFGGTATGVIIIGTEIQLVDYDPEDAVRLGLTALPPADADAPGGIPISDAGALDLDTQLATLTNGTYGLSAIKTLVDDLESRLTVSTAGLATEANQTTIINHLTDVKGATFSGATDSLEAIRSRGDIAWITGGTGGGSNAVTINVKDDSAVNVVDCYVEIWDSAGTSFISRTNTNSSGDVTFNLDSNTYIVKMHKTGYYFANQTLVVNGTESEAYTGTILTPDAATDPTLCRIYGYYFDPAGSTYSAVKSLIKLTAIYEASDNNYYTSELVGTYNTTTGLLYFDVIQGASVTLEIPILNVKKSFVVPAETLYKISDIA